MSRLFLLLLCLGAASASPVSITLHVSVLPACEVREASAERVGLRCTSGFTPDDPGRLPGLAGTLPTGLYTLVSTGEAAGGGTLNVYTVAPDPAATGGLVEFY